eukprot:4244736-Prymnesium_polylepis.2
MSRISMVSPKMTKNLYTPLDVDPKPNVLHTSCEITILGTASRAHAAQRIGAVCGGRESDAPRAHRRSGLMNRCSARTKTLTSSATRTRACTESSPINSTHPVNVSLRLISTLPCRHLWCQDVGSKGYLLQPEFKSMHGSHSSHQKPAAP